mmetsp:Transcript_41215/g.96362  ORF Transcript_41215/g.96362 Transcript_41215/m.96362 type:complete len:583 (-) Transcript_41215:713-2461(-)
MVGAEGGDDQRGLDRVGLAVDGTEEGGQALAGARAHAEVEEQQVQPVQQGLGVERREAGEVEVEPVLFGPAIATAAKEVGEEVQRAGHGRLTADLELGRHPALRGNGAGRPVAGRVEVEHRGRQQRALAEGVVVAVEVLDAVLAAAALGPQAAQHVGEADDRLALLGDVGGRAVAARLGVQQHGTHDCLQIAARARAVVGEHGRHATDIGRAGVAGHQALDQLLGEKGRHIGVQEDDVQRIGHVLLGRLAGRQQLAVEQLLLARRVEAGPGLHRLGPQGLDVLVVVTELVRVVVVQAPETPAAECLRQALDDALVVGGLGLAGRVELGRAIGIELDETDGEQLQHFTRKVLVWMGALVGALLLAAQQIEVVAHGRVQRHVLQQRAPVAEGIAVEHVHIAAHGRRADVGRDIADDEDLQQRPADAGTQLVLAGQPLLPDGLVAHLLAELGRLARLLVAAALAVDIVHVQGRRLGELRRQPGIEALRDEGIDLFRPGGTEAGLAQEAGCIAPRRRRRAGRRAGTDRSGPGAAAATTAATGGEQGGRRQRRSRTLRLMGFGLIRGDCPALFDVRVHAISCLTASL